MSFVKVTCALSSFGATCPAAGAGNATKARATAAGNPSDTAGLHRGSHLMCFLLSFLFFTVVGLEMRVGEIGQNLRHAIVPYSKR
jgi:hypothetical protein